MCDFGDRKSVTLWIFDLFALGDLSFAIKRDLNSSMESSGYSVRKVNPLLCVWPSRVMSFSRRLLDVIRLFRGVQHGLPHSLNRAWTRST